MSWNLPPGVTEDDLFFDEEGWEWGDVEPLPRLGDRLVQAARVFRPFANGDPCPQDQDFLGIPETIICAGSSSHAI